MINNLTKLEIRVAGERTKGSIFTTLKSQTFLTSLKSIRPRRHFVPTSFSRRFNIEPAEPVQTKGLLIGPGANIDLKTDNTLMWK